MTEAIEDYHHLTTASFIFLFQLGYMIFEYGAVRPKNADTVLIKFFVVLALAAIATFSFGYAFAYGDSYVIGTKYFFSSVAFEEKDSQNATKWVLLFATCSMTA
jgi:ammonia channel protein AmtB